MTPRDEALALYNELISLRRDFHAHPELGLQEFRTAEIIEAYLQDLGLDEVRRCTQTGVVGVLRGGREGKVICFRSDIDALPVTEETGLPFASKTPCLMHACGHDGHIAILLIAAKILAAHRAEIPGTVVFLFQPNEEDAGAERMIRAGALEHPRPDAIFGMHLWAYLPTDTVGVCPGPLMASSDYFYLTLIGKPGHGGSPHHCVNPIDTAAHVLDAFKTLCALELNPMEPTVISVGTIHGGTKEVIIPEKVELSGSMRCLHSGRDAVRARMRQLVEGVCKTYRCGFDLTFQCGNTLLENDPTLAALAADAAGEILGADKIVSSGIRTMVGEDFAEFTHIVPGAYYFYGSGNPTLKTDFDHHNPRFDIDEDALPGAVAVQLAIVKKFLEF